ncbi:MAG: putative DNA modification/repair radical SAM protein [Gracilibacteraceae bacterium]|nr:putative DNA modification/repair radical SAM protein [Gracilibacteraceae bacterium]
MRVLHSPDLLEKLQILAGAAKYDVSCASSGTTRRGGGGLGNAKGYGICHTWAADGRCVALLKVLFTNKCVNDCVYCACRRGSDTPRAAFTARELAELTVEFYRRNYIEGLFLSSAIEKNPDYTTENIIAALSLLRREHKFFGYIHVKAIPGTDPTLISRLGLLADRVSINLELPSARSLALLAPQKQMPALLAPVRQIYEESAANQAERRRFRSAPKFVPAGQSTQFIVGATPDSDLTLLSASETLYRRFALKRVYFSAYVPLNDNPLLPALSAMPPLRREHRLYQADWLLRFYGFQAGELLDESQPNLDTELDPKIIWALRHLHVFPLEINRASPEELLRVPGIGVVSARRIVRQRRFCALNYDDLGKIGVVIKRARYFITCRGKYYGGIPLKPEIVRSRLLPPPAPAFYQPSLFDGAGSARDE